MKCEINLFSINLLRLFLCCHEKNLRLRILNCLFILTETKKLIYLHMQNLMLKCYHDKKIIIL